MQKHLFLSLSLLIVCEFALAIQPNPYEINTGSVRVCLIENEKKIITQQAHNDERPNTTAQSFPKFNKALTWHIASVPKGKLNIKDKAYQNRFLRNHHLREIQHHTIFTNRTDDDDINLV